MNILSRCTRNMIAASLICLLDFGMTQAAELVMLEQDGCAWCLRWDEEISGIYPKTTEGKLAPLRRVDIDEPWPLDLAGINPDQYTPTFVLVHEGVELGRLRGYAGDEFFWVLLGEMLEKIPR